MAAPDRKQVIIDAATVLFAERGRDGTGMEAIAEAAGCNKSLIYYYFTSRETLYAVTVRAALETIIGGIGEQLADALPALDSPALRLEGIVHAYFRTFESSGSQTRLIIHALTNHHEIIRAQIEAIKQADGFTLPKLIFPIFREGMERGVFRTIDPVQIMVSLIGMIQVARVARPIILIAASDIIDDGEEFMRHREAAVVDLILHGILEPSAPPSER